MADGYLALDLMYLGQRRRRLERRAEMREWRDSHDPFELVDDEFINLFRLPPQVVMDLIDTLSPILQRQRSIGITCEQQVFTALRFYAAGCYQRAIGEHINLGLSQPSVSRCVRDVTNAINEILLRQWVQFPMTPGERQVARENFRAAPQHFEGTLGAVDCTYVNIIAPRIHEEAYVNHWGDHSLNVQAICDPNLKILNINARFPGARHDAYIWRNSPVRQVMSRYYDNGERNTWLIADDGYPLEPWLMTPLPHEQPGTPRYRYNEELCRARSYVERLFGVLKSEFRCLSAQRKLMYQPGMAGKIVNACAVLHNMRIAHRVAEIEVDDWDIEQQILDNIPDPEDENDDHGNPLVGRALATRIQNGFIAKQYGQ